MSIPKEKTILLKIKEILKKYRPLTAYLTVHEISELVYSYEDPGYIGELSEGRVSGAVAIVQESDGSFKMYEGLPEGPIVGEAETEEK